MTRKKAIEIVVETAKGCSWYPADWEYCSTKTFRRKAKWGKIHVVAFSEKMPHDALAAKNGFHKRCGEDGWDFTRKWLEENGYL